MCDIDWCSFTWQAFATLTTGVIAAGGATIIGIKQVGISRKQAMVAEGQKEVAAAQAETARAALEVAKAQALTARLAQRSNLFDRRYAIYETLIEYSHTSMSGDVHALIAMNTKIVDSFKKMKFLFPKSVQTEINEHMEQAEECSNAVMSRLSDPAKGAEAKAARKKLHQSILTLADRMGEEMQLHGA